MSEGQPPPPGHGDGVATKIARLVEERGWNQSDFARITNLNLQTVRQILDPVKSRRLRNATVSACARALGLTVNELRQLPLDRLLPRMHHPRPADGDTSPRRLYEEATQPELLRWVERNPDRAARMSDDEMNELLSLQGTGGPLTQWGVEQFAELIERKRALAAKISAIAGTEYLDLLEKFVEVLFEKVQPYGDRR